MSNLILKTQAYFQKSVFEDLKKKELTSSTHIRDSLDLAKGSRRKGPSAIERPPGAKRGASEGRVDSQMCLTANGTSCGASRDEREPAGQRPEELVLQGLLM